MHLLSWLTSKWKYLFLPCVRLCLCVRSDFQFSVHGCKSSPWVFEFVFLCAVVCRWITRLKSSTEEGGCLFTVFSVILRICFIPTQWERDTEKPSVFAWNYRTLRKLYVRGGCVCQQVGVNLFIHLQNETYLIRSKGIRGSKGQRKSKTSRDVQMKTSSVHLRVFLCSYCDCCLQTHEEVTEMHTEGLWLYAQLMYATPCFALSRGCSLRCMSLSESVCCLKKAELANSVRLFPSARTVAYSCVKMCLYLALYPLPKCVCVSFYVGVCVCGGHRDN